MFLNKKLFLLCASLCVFTVTYAQIEVARLSSQSISTIGFGGFLHLTFPVNDNKAIITEGGAYYFGQNDKHVVVAPILLGYRYLFSISDDVLSLSDEGFYVEPVLGYSFGATDIAKTDAAGTVLYKPDGSEIDQKVMGATAGMGFGYLFQPSEHIQFSISLRYEHTFVSGDSLFNIVSLRLSHNFSFRRRD